MKDVFIAPSRSESFNYSVLEALNAGNPCLVSDIPGHEHYLEAKAVFNFKLTEPAEFAAELLNAMTTNPNTQKTQEFLNRYQSSGVCLKYSNLAQKL